MRSLVQALILPRVLQFKDRHLNRLASQFKQTRESAPFPVEPQMIQFACSAMFKVTLFYFKTTSWNSPDSILHKFRLAEKWILQSFHFTSSQNCQSAIFPSRKINLL